MRTAIVTGASRGLGRALSIVLADRGWSLVIDARSATHLEVTEKELVHRGAFVVSVTGDVSSARHRAGLVSAARALGDLELLVNNAAVLLGSPEHVLFTNLIAPLDLIEQARPLLDAARRPRVVNVSSEAALEVRRGLKEYCASKAALDHYSRVLAAENPGWSVWSVDPGEMRTDMLQRALPGRDLSDRQSPEVVALRIADLIESAHPSGRVRVADS